MTDREVMNLALEALFEAQDEIREWGSYASDYFQKKHDLLGSIAKLQPVINTLRQALAQDEKVSISRCKQCGGALPVTGALDRTGECDCIRQLRVFSTIAWFNAPIKSEWGEDMMCASVSIDKNHTLTLYCERSQIHKVPNIIKELL